MFASTSWTTTAGPVFPPSLGSPVSDATPGAPGVMSEDTGGRFLVGAADDDSRSLRYPTSPSMAWRERQTMPPSATSVTSVARFTVAP